MKKNLLLALLGWGVFAGPAVAERHLRVWFDTPNPQTQAFPWDNASVMERAGDGMGNGDPNWEKKSLPLGNGSIGANVMGVIGTERISFNEKTLWRGGPNTAKGAAYYWNVNKESAGVLKDIRQAFVDGDQEKAARLTQDNFDSPVPYGSTDENPSRFGSFTTAGEFRIATGIAEEKATQYVRALSLDSAMATVSFTADNIAYKRTYFVSHPDQVMVMHFTADRAGSQNLQFSYAPNPVMKGSFKKDGSNGLLYVGRLENNKMQYALRVQALTKGGKLENKNGVLKVTGADEVTFLVTADTDYKVNFAPDFTDPKTYVGVNPVKTTQEWMNKAEAKPYAALLQDHYTDYASLFNRVQLSLNTEVEGKWDYLPTPQRLQRYRTGAPDYGLETLYYQFGRYLLIASSRPGNLPANLQGMWHNNVDGPWRIDYHNNINLQMNYWPSCATNLAECQLPLIDFIRSLVKPGEKTAKAYFGARGWTASISGNIFGFTTPLGSKDMSWNFCPLAGPWLATHVWDHYDYTRDVDFLREVGYELLKSSANFAVDYMWKKPDGTYTAAPSTSPEHGPIDEGTTFAHAVIREILLDAIAASKVLGTDAEACREWENVLANMVPYKVGRYGQLMEWSKDIDNPYDEHRHVNHLYGLHPGKTLSPVTTPKLAKAARVVLEHRGDGATGWSMGWKLNQWARLHDGNRAYTLYGNLLKNGTNDNLWDSHPPFQIDGNFGGTAGVTEMLLQSHMGFLHLLPSLPAVWHEGKLTGVCARGNFTVDLFWNDNLLQKAVVRSNAGEPCHVRYKDMELKFDTEKGKTYTLTVADGALKLARQ